MNIHSLGLRSDLMFFKHEAVVENKQDYIVVKTPENPAFFWGNLLIYPQGPLSGDYTKWIDNFNKEFSSDSEIKHMTFTWDVTNDTCSEELEIFKNNGFEYDETIVLISEGKLKVKYENNDFIYKRINTEDEWCQVIDLQVNVNSDSYKEESYRPFINKRFKHYKSLSEKGLGYWYGAFKGDQLVADLGLYHEDNIGRFQNIETKLEFRKKGIAQSLMNYAANNLTCNFLVIEADEEGPAINMYKTIGFEIKERISGVCLYDKTKWKND